MYVSISVCQEQLIFVREIMSYLKDFLPYLFGNKVGKSPTLPEIFYSNEMSLEEKLMFKTLQGELDHFIAEVDFKTLNSKERFQILNFYQFLNSKHKSMIDREFVLERVLFKKALTTDFLGKKGIKEILDFNSSDLKLIATFRKDRRYPGRLIIQKANGELYRSQNGKIFSLPILGFSSRGLSFHHKNGWTPCGVYRVNGVMPLADKFLEFGRYHRLIVDFIEGSLDEEILKTKIPFTHFERNWWKQGVLARELGRSLLRIHGAGEVNRKITSPYFPFVPTSGCIATREFSFLGKKIHDQRRLLDALMDAQELPITEANEVKIQALLYVFELDDRKSKVILRDFSL